MLEEMKTPPELELESRKRIYDLIKKNEGIYLRQICRMLKKRIGVIQYHLNILEKARLIKSSQDGRMRRFFLPKTNQNDLILLTQKTKKVFNLIKEENKTRTQISDSLGISVQAVNYHLKKLIGVALIIEDPDNQNKTIYYRRKK